MRAAKFSHSLLSVDVNLCIYVDGYVCMYVWKVPKGSRMVVTLSMTSRQLNKYRLTESDVEMTSYVPDCGHDVISLSSGESSCSVCPAHTQQRPPVPDPFHSTFVLVILYKLVTHCVYTAPQNWHSVGHRFVRNVPSLLIRLLI